MNNKNKKFVWVNLVVNFFIFLFFLFHNDNCYSFLSFGAELSESVAKLNDQEKREFSWKELNNISTGHLGMDLPDFWGIYRIGADLVSKELKKEENGKLNQLDRDDVCPVGLLDGGFEVSNRIFEGRVYQEQSLQSPLASEANLEHGTHVLGTITSPEKFSVFRSPKIKVIVGSYLNREEPRNNQGCEKKVTTYDNNLLEQIDNILNISPLKVISASLEFGEKSSLAIALKNKIVDKKFVFVVASGNESKNLDDTYSSDVNEKDGVLFIGSIDPLGTQSEFSNSGNNLFIVAPGEKIFSYAIDINRPEGGDLFKYKSKKCGEYNLIKKDGTSMATPHVSGVIASMLKASPNLSNNDIVSILQKSAIPSPIGSERNRFYGYEGRGIFPWVRSSQSERNFCFGCLNPKNPPPLGAIYYPQIINNYPKFLLVSLILC